MFFFKPVVDNYLTGSTRDYNNRDIVLMLIATVSRIDKCFSFDMKFSKDGSSRYREPQISVGIIDYSDVNWLLQILLPRQNEWFHAHVNLSGAGDLFTFLLSVYRPNFTIGLDNVSTDCSPGKRKYPGPFTSFYTQPRHGMYFNRTNDFLNCKCWERVLFESFEYHSHTNVLEKDNVAQMFLIGL